MLNYFKVEAIAPTVYQRSSLYHFGMKIKEVGNGSFRAVQFFDTEEEAKSFLKTMAINYYDEFEGQSDEHLSNIDRCGFLEIDAVTAHIEEVFAEE